MHILRARHAVVFVVLIGLVGCQTGSGGSWWKSNPFKGSTASNQPAAPVKPSSMFAGTPSGAAPAGSTAATANASATNPSASRGGYPGMATSFTSAPPFNGSTTNLTPAGAGAAVAADPMLTPARGYSELPSNPAARNSAAMGAGASAGSFGPANSGPALSQGYPRDSSSFGNAAPGANSLRNSAPAASRYDRSSLDRTASLDRPGPSFDRPAGNLDRTSVGMDRSASTDRFGSNDRLNSGSNRMSAGADRFAPAANPAPSFDAAAPRFDSAATAGGSPYRGAASLDNVRSNTPDAYPSAPRNSTADRGYDSAPLSNDRGAAVQPDYRSRDAAPSFDNRPTAGDYRSNDAGYRSTPATNRPASGNYGPASGSYGPASSGEQDRGFLPGSTTTYPSKSSLGGGTQTASRSFLDPGVTQAGFDQPTMR